MTSPAVCATVFNSTECGVLAVGRCIDCGDAFCESHQGSQLIPFGGIQTLTNLCSSCSWLRWDSEKTAREAAADEVEAAAARVAARYEELLDLISQAGDVHFVGRAVPPPGPPTRWERWSGRVQAVQVLDAAVPIGEIRIVEWRDHGEEGIGLRLAGVTRARELVSMVVERNTTRLTNSWGDSVPRKLPPGWKASVVDAMEATASRLGLGQGTPGT